jgi:hypothetical protein
MSTETLETPTTAPPEPARKTFLRNHWPIIATATAIAVLAAATFAITTVTEANAATQRQVERLDDIRYASQVTDDYFTAASSKILQQPGVQAFHDDPVFQGADWAAYNALNAPYSDKAHQQVLEALRASVAKLDEARKAEGAELEDKYEAAVKSGGINASRLGGDFLQAVAYTRSACKASDAGSTPAQFIAGWTADNANPKPVTYLEADADKTAAAAITQKAYTAAMTAGVTHLCQ